MALRTKRPPTKLAAQRYAWCAKMTLLTTTPVTRPNPLPVRATNRKVVHVAAGVVVVAVVVARVAIAKMVAMMRRAEMAMQAARVRHAPMIAAPRSHERSALERE
jgi:hypothetical protein